MRDLQDFYKIRRFKNIVAFQKGKDIFAFNSENLQVAQLTSKHFESLQSVRFDTSQKPEQMNLKGKNLIPGPESTVLVGDSFTEFENSNQAVSDEIQDLIDWSAEYSETKSPIKQFKVQSLNINVTQICNLHCLYCAAGGDGSYGDPIKKISIEKTFPQILYFMKQLQPGERFHISFLGGEPLLYPEGIKLICEYAQTISVEKNIHLTFKITTNGTIFNSAVSDILKTYKPSLVISMDGPPEINDLLRPQKNKKSSSSEILKTLQELEKIRSLIGTLIVSAVFETRNTEVLKAYHYFKKFNFDCYDFNFSLTSQDADAQNEFLNQYVLLAQQAFDSGGEEELRKIYLFEHYFDILDHQKKLENHCGIGKSLAILDSRNNIYNCPWTVGSKKDQIGAELDLDQNRLNQEYRSSLIERNDCHDCWAKYLCGGGCSFVHNSTTLIEGQKVKKNHLFCLRTRFLAALAIDYYQSCRDIEK